MEIISPTDLIPIDMFIECAPIKIDLVYAQKKHPRNIFKTALYYSKSRLWTHKNLAAITILTARRLNQKFGYILEIQDSLRTVDAQEIMQETQIVKEHPEWMEEPDRLLAPPGAGGHPRGMAIDVRVLDKTGQGIDMGTPFDFMEEQSHRNYIGFSDEILKNRKTLEKTYLESAKTLGFPFLGLPSEWWDFRFPADYTRNYQALKDEDLPPQMQMTRMVENNIADLPQEHFDKLAQNILNTVNENI